MLWPFFADLGKTPDRVVPADVLAWGPGIGKSGRTLSATTIGARIACLSSFYKFLIRMGMLASNPSSAGRGDQPQSLRPLDRGRHLLLLLPGQGRQDRTP